MIQNQARVNFTTFTVKRPVHRLLSLDLQIYFQDFQPPPIFFQPPLLILEKIEMIEFLNKKEKDTELTRYKTRFIRPNMISRDDEGFSFNGRHCHSDVIHASSSFCVF